MKKKFYYEDLEKDDYTRHLIVELEFYRCGGNKHKHFAITGATYHRKPFTDRNMSACGCIHDEIQRLSPVDYSEAIKYHLVGEDQPMHYVANTLYHIEQGKLDYARNSAVWPELTDDQLMRMNKEVLLLHLPTVMVGFYNMLEKFGLLEDSDQDTRASWVKQYEEVKDIPLPFYTDEELTALSDQKARKRQEKLNKEAEEIEANLIKKQERDQYVAQCKIALLKAGCDLENLIYYSHSATWCLGWREPVTEKELNDFRELCHSIEDKLLDSDGIRLVDKLDYKLKD